MAHPGDCQGVLALGVEAPDQLQSDAVPWAPSASDALDVVHQDEAADVALRLPPPADADAGKLVDRAPDVPGQVASRSELRVVRWAQPAAAAAPCKQGAARFAERSFAEQEAAAAP